MKHIGYIRVSTKKQHEGPEAQRAAINHWAQMNGVEIASFHVETVSGGAPLERRVRLMDAIDALEAGDVLVAAKRDRIGRNVVLVAMIESLVKRKNAKLKVTDGTSDDDSPESMLLRTMIDAFAEYERAAIRARTRAALAAKKSRGEATSGTAPYGWRKEGKMFVEDPDEQKGLARILGLRGSGASFREIAQILESEGFKPRGSRWHLTSVARCCR